MTIIRKHTRAFTLVESLVAVAILAVAVSGPMFSASRALVATAITQDQFTASYLAQEGIEHIRAIRDNEFLATRVSSASWANFKTNIETYCLGPNASCTVDPTLPIGYGAGHSVQSYTGTPLWLSSTGIYSQQQTFLGTATKFTRRIQVSPASANDERATSTVSWSFHGLTYSISSVDNLTSWQ